MALVIANNPLALVAQNNLAKTTVDLSRSLERLSSGFKVNRGADGPAALVISEKLRAQIAGLKAAITNSEKAVSLVQTAEGALTEINNLLVKIRSLAIDSGNAGVNDAETLAANRAIDRLQCFGEGARPYCLGCSRGGAMPGVLRGGLGRGAIPILSSAACGHAKKTDRDEAERCLGQEGARLQHDTV